jgi:hypothetical protein
LSHYLEDVFVAVTHIADLSPTDLYGINIEMLNDSQPPTTRSTITSRIPLKTLVQSPVDFDPPQTNIVMPSGLLKYDLRSTGRVHSSHFLEDDDALSSRDSELTTARKTPSRLLNSNNNNNNNNNSNHNKQYETVSEDAPTPNDLVSRKLKSKNKVVCLIDRTNVTCQSKYRSFSSRT